MAFHSFDFQCVHERKTTIPAPPYALPSRSLQVPCIALRLPYKSEGNRPVSKGLWDTGQEEEGAAVSFAHAHEFGIAGDALHDKRILLVDDEQELASMVAAILHRAGFHAVETAHCASEALRIIDARATSPDNRLPAVRPRHHDAGHERVRPACAHSGAPRPCIHARAVPFGQRRALRPRERPVAGGPTTTSRSRFFPRSWSCASQPCCVDAMPRKARCSSLRQVA